MQGGHSMAFMLEDNLLYPLQRGTCVVRGRGALSLMLVEQRCSRSHCSITQPCCPRPAQMHVCRAGTAWLCYAAV